MLQNYAGDSVLAYFCSTALNGLNPRVMSSNLHLALVTPSLLQKGPGDL